jgi:hypothetical protein
MKDRTVLEAVIKAMEIGLEAEVKMGESLEIARKAVVQCEEYQKTLNEAMYLLKTVLDYVEKLDRGKALTEKDRKFLRELNVVWRVK